MKKTTGKTHQIDPKITELEAQVAQSQAKVARALADYANLERRFASESSAVVKFANSSLIEKLLDIREHLAMAASVIKDQSLSMILSSLDKLLTEEGVTQVKTDGLFDPRTMESQELVDGEKDHVIQVIRPGYTLHDRVLRNARVTVGNGNSIKQ